MERLVYDFSSIPWEKYFLARQHGAGPRFYGTPFQRGKGLATILSSLRFLIPAFLNSTFGKTVVETGKAIAADVKEGATLKEAVKKEGRAAIKTLTGIGKRKKRGIIVKRRRVIRRLPLFKPL